MLDMRPAGIFAGMAPALRKSDSDGSIIRDHQVDVADIGGVPFVIVGVNRWGQDSQDQGGNCQAADTLQPRGGKGIAIFHHLYLRIDRPPKKPQNT